MKKIEDLLGRNPVAVASFEVLVQDALLNPLDDTRRDAILSLRGLLPPGFQLRKGYVGDGYIMFDLENRNHIEPYYVCDVPREYPPGQKAVPVPFELI